MIHPVVDVSHTAPQPPIPSPFGGPPPIADPIAQAAAEIAAKRKEFLEAAHRDYLQATDQQVALIELERDARIKQLDQLGLAEADYLAARDELNTVYAKRIEETQTRSVAVIADAMELLKRIFTDVLASMVLDADFSWKQIGESFAREVAQMAITAAASGVFNLAVGAVGGIPGFFTTLLAGRASGGPVSPGRAYMVGEKGPEPFIPRVPGTILPHGALGGRTVVQVINAGQPLRVTGTRERQQGPDRMIEVLVEQAVAKSITGGGRVARAMEQRFSLGRRGVVG